MKYKILVLFDSQLAYTNQPDDHLCLKGKSTQTKNIVANEF